MPTQLPELSDLDHGVIRHSQIAVILDDFVCRRQHHISGTEAGQSDIHALVPQPDQLSAARHLVPGRQLGQPVVRQDVCPSLGVGQMLHQDAGRVLDAFELRRLDPAMAGDHVAGPVDQHRGHKTELPERAPQLLDLGG